MGVRKEPTGWATGVVHPRIRRGRPDMELRSPRYALTLTTALRALEDPRHMNGHGGVASSLLCGTAGLHDVDTVLLHILKDPGTALDALRAGAGISQAEWSRRSGVDVRTIRRIVREGQEPLLSTVGKLLGALQ